MHRVLLLGAGKIGRMIARLLIDSGDYSVVVGDVSADALGEKLRAVACQANLTPAAGYDKFA